MRARVKPDDNWHVVTACAGINFTKNDWLEVPPGREEEALNNPHLEVDLGKALVAEKIISPPETPPPSAPDELEKAIIEEETETILELHVVDKREPHVLDEVSASDAAHTLALASDIDLRSIKGSGKDGLITVTDVRKAMKEADDA